MNTGSKNGVNLIGIKVNANEQTAVIVHSIEIGNWNIDLSATKEVNHTLQPIELQSIIISTAMIQNDTSTTYTPIQVVKVDGTTIYLYSDYKGAEYDSSEINRGTITLIYTPTN